MLIAKTRLPFEAGSKKSSEIGGLRFGNFPPASTSGKYDSKIRGDDVP